MLCTFGVLLLVVGMKGATRRLDRILYSGIVRVFRRHRFQLRKMKTTVKPKARIQDDSGLIHDLLLRFLRPLAVLTGNLKMPMVPCIHVAREMSNSATVKH